MQEEKIVNIVQSLPQSRVDLLPVRSLPKVSIVGGGGGGGILRLDTGQASIMH